MDFRANLDVLKNANFNNVYLYKKDDQGNLGTFSKSSFLGRIWILFNSDKVKSDKVTDVIVGLFEDSNIRLLNSDQKLYLSNNKVYLSNNLTTLQRHFGNGGMKALGVTGKIQGVIAKINASISDQGSSSAGSNRDRVGSLSELGGAARSITVKPQTVRPEPQAVQPQPQQALKDPRQDGIVAAISNFTYGTTATSDRKTIGLPIVKDRENAPSSEVFGDPRGVVRIKKGKAGTNGSIVVGGRLNPQIGQLRPVRN